MNKNMIDMKRYVLFILGVVFCSSAQAQVKVTVKGGAVTSSMSRSQHYLDDLWQEYGSRQTRRLGFAAGAAVEIPVRRFLYLQSEVLYVRRGYVTHGTWYSGDTYVDYIELPFLAKLDFASIQTWRFSVYAGLHLAHALGGGFFYNNRILNRSGTHDIRFRRPPENYAGFDTYIGPDQGNRLEVGGIVGVAAARRWGAGEVVFDLRYGRAFTDLIENDRSRFRTVSLLAGYSVPLKRR